MRTVPPGGYLIERADNGGWILYTTWSDVHGAQHQNTTTYQPYDFWRLLDDMLTGFGLTLADVGLMLQGPGSESEVPTRDDEG